MFSTVDREFEHDSLAHARDAATEDAAHSGGRIFPCTVSLQGGRPILSTAFPLGFIARHIRIDPATRGGSPRDKVNRPILVDHVRTIKRYLLDNRNDYFLGALSLNIRKLPQLHVARTNAPIRSGYLVIDDATTFDVTDGQHRVGAITGIPNLKITGALDEDPSFANDSITVQITIESEIERIHQNFADAAQTKPIPPSLLAAFNMREPLNRVLSGIVKGSRLLNERIDETNKTLPKHSQALFLLNQVRGFVKELLVGDYSIADDALMRTTAKRLATKELQDSFVAQTLELLDILTSTMEPWREIADLPLHSDQANKIPDLRATYLNMTATGLVLIGHTAFEINKLSLGHDERLKKFEEIATTLNWRRSSPLWTGNVIIGDSLSDSLKVLSGKQPVRNAEIKIGAVLRLPQSQSRAISADDDAVIEQPED